MTQASKSSIQFAFLQRNQQIEILLNRCYQIQYEKIQYQQGRQDQDQQREIDQLHYNCSQALEEENLEKEWNNRTFEELGTYQLLKTLLEEQLKHDTDILLMKKVENDDRKALQHIQTLKQAERNEHQQYDRVLRVLEKYEKIEEEFYQCNLFQRNQHTLEQVMLDQERLCMLNPFLFLYFNIS